MSETGQVLSQEAAGSAGSMVERVAKALRPDLWSDDLLTRHQAASPLTVYDAQRPVLADAHRAMEAMREPTPQMVGVGWAKQESGDNSPAEIEAAYRAMIDAALP